MQNRKRKIKWKFIRVSLKNYQWLNKKVDFHKRNSPNSLFNMWRGDDEEIEDEEEKT